MTYMYQTRQKLTSGLVVSTRPDRDRASLRARDSPKLKQPRDHPAALRELRARLPRADRESALFLLTKQRLSIMCTRATEAFYYLYQGNSDFLLCSSPLAAPSRATALLPSASFSHAYRELAAFYHYCITGQHNNNISHHNNAISQHNNTISQHYKTMIWPRSPRPASRPPCCPPRAARTPAANAAV